MQKITLAGGCFWGLEDLIRKQNGVINTRVGYTGGHLKNPKYDDTHDSKSGHAEAVEITFDETKTNLENILLFFFQIHDPTTLNRQGNDIGTQYRSAIFYADEDQYQKSNDIIQKLDNAKIYDNPVQTTLEKLDVFYEGEDYHQDYLVKNPNGYTCHWIRPNWTIKI